MPRSPKPAPEVTIRITGTQGTYTFSATIGNKKIELTGISAGEAVSEVEKLLNKE